MHSYCGCVWRCS